jgi:hypothetical protein
MKKPIQFDEVADIYDEYVKIDFDISLFFSLLEAFFGGYHYE